MDTVFFLLFCSLFAKKRKEISIPAFHIRRYTTYFYYVRKKETQLLSSNLPEFSHWFQNPRLKLHLLSKTIARLYKGVFAHAKKSSNECAFSRVQSRNLMVLFSIVSFGQLLRDVSFSDPFDFCSHQRFSEQRGHFMLDRIGLQPSI